MAFSDAAIEAKWLFQFAFCAVALAIIWGTTLERLRYAAHAAFAVVFSALIYPIVSHWVFGGGWLQASVGTQDFAGPARPPDRATAGLAALLISARAAASTARRGRSAIPGHSMPLVGLGTVILFIGWFGFNAARRSARPTCASPTWPWSPAGGTRECSAPSSPPRSSADRRHRHGRQRDDRGLVAITAPSGYISTWPARSSVRRGRDRGGRSVIVERRLDDPVGVISVHGMAGVWGTLSCACSPLPRLAQYNGVGEPDGGLFYSGRLDQLGDQALGVLAVFAFVFAASMLTFAVIRATIGMRVSEAEEEAGLDIVEHGMYGYPEQFIHLEHLHGNGRERAEAPR